MVETEVPVPPTACSNCRGGIPAGATYCPHCGARQDTPPAIGPELPGYTIARPLGSGGAADVYLARQDALDRQVAIKVLRHGVDDPKQWRRFRREAQTIARLSAHAHVVTVHTAGRAKSGQPFLVTEYLDRGSLGDVLAADGPLSPALAARVGVAIADALLAAHGLGILHRDIKPGNVLLGHDGSIKLGDFGIARLLEHAGTTTDVIAFTPEHVAPELLRSEPDGPWSDVYGLASTVAAALLGHSLFRMGPEERIDAFLSRKLTAPPPALPGWVPPVLARPITAALDPEPRRRPRLFELRHQLAAAAEELSRSTTTTPAATTVISATSADGHERERRTGSTPIVRRSAGQSGVLAVLAAVVLAGALVAAAALAGLFSGDEEEGSTRTSPAVSAAPTASAPAPSTTLSVAPLSTDAPTTPAPPPTPGPTTAASPTVAQGAPATAPPPTQATAAPSTVAPTTSTPAATLPPSTNPAALLTPTGAERYLRAYYDAVEAGDYEQTWVQLAPEFQTGMARSFQYYSQFWDDNDIELGAIELVDVEADRAVVHAELRWNGSPEPTVEQFTLRRADDGTVLIAEQRTLDR